MFKNKHVVIAMLVAPMLAIMAWYAVDHYVGEQPHAAKAGAAYSLVAKSNCRYASGQCDLANGNFELTLRPMLQTDSSLTMALQSRFPLERAMIGLVEAGAEGPPSILQASDATAQNWVGALAPPANSESTFRLAVIAKETTYFAEIPVTFLEVED